MLRDPVGEPLKARTTIADLGADPPLNLSDVEAR
jgi:hypothetical protein